MTPLFSKLNLKGQREILVVNPPPGFDRELDALTDVAVHHDPAEVERVEFALVFVQSIAEIEAASASVLPKAHEDAVVWFAYPKGSSKRYRCDFNRDRGWESVGEAGFEPVRQVAIDEDWSALRFRRPEFIKSMTRDPSRASTAAGKARVTPPAEDG